MSASYVGMNDPRFKVVFFDPRLADWFAFALD
jgi:hypothetical protein